MVRNLLALTGLLAIAMLAAVGIQAYGYYNDPYDDPPPQVRVSYRGLDLADPEGRRILEQRINAAINDVCPRESGSALWTRRYDRECREQAIAGVEPQVHAAVARAEERRESIAYAEADMALPPLRRGPRHRFRDAPPPVTEAEKPRYFRPGPPPREPIYASRSPDRPMRLVRKTVTTTVTTTAPSLPAKVVRDHWRRGYARLDGPGTWLPPYAWPAIEHAIGKALVSGRTVEWSARERSGYVTVSAARWINRCLCRNVRVVKHAEGRQVVVAQGLRCRWPDGRFSR